MVESAAAIDGDEEIVADNEISSAPSLGRPTFRGGHVSLSVVIVSDDSTWSA